MHTSVFFKIFPPPKFMVMKYAGLDISDDSIHCLQYASHPLGLTVGKHASMDVPAGLIDGGDIADEKKLIALLTEFDKKYDLTYVRVSLPEEKAYLFQTDVPNADIRTIEQNIEFKLEENVPLSPADAVFYFDLIGPASTVGLLRASVSVVPRTYIEHYISILQSAGIFPIAFEVAPRSLARALVAPGSQEVQLFVHIMNRKTGIYIVSGNTVSFTSTVSWGSHSTEDTAPATYVSNISREINRVHSYWLSRGTGQPLSQIVLIGKGAAEYQPAFQNVITGTSIPVHVANIWHNAFNIDRYVPPVSREDSLDYGVAAGLALPS